MKTKLSLLAISTMMMFGCQTITTEHIEENQVSEPPLSVSNKTVKNKLSPSSQGIEDIQDDVEDVTLIWQRMRNGMQLHIADKALVDKYRQWYIDNPQHLAIVTERAAPFLYYILEEVEKRNLPSELALLPVIESAFDPKAYSRSHASGLWQLTSPTATTFGVKDNWWYDGRRDLRASTKAALDLLEYLYKKMDNNWIYAIAAYNSGEGRVFNAIKRNENKGKPVEFWQLNLPKETAHYVPQLLALADVINNADALNIPLYPIANKPAIEIVNIESQLDLNLAAQMAGISLQELQQLNPGMLRWASAPQGPHFLAVPSSKSKKFKQNLAALAPDDRVNWIRYKIKSGDTISEIAQQFDTSPNMIRSNNNIKGNNIVAGRFLIIPVASQDPDLGALSQDQVLVRSKVKKSSNQPSKYTVRSGDTLWAIANANGVSISQIQKWNNLSKDKPLSIGQVLTVVPKTVVEQSQANEKVVNYKVKSGDSLSLIASRYKVSVADLMEWNSLKKNQPIFPGQMLKLLKSS